jgi:actin-like ATPase involved in cell morphogenesis
MVEVTLKKMPPEMPVNYWNEGMVDVGGVKRLHFSLLFIVTYLTSLRIPN